MGLPVDKKIIFTFGQRMSDFSPVIPTFKEISKKYPLLFLVASSKDVDWLKKEKSIEIDLREERPSIKKVYDYLHASDCLILHRKHTGGSKDLAVVSSSTYQCLGALCPIIATDVNLFWPFKREVMKYRDMEGLEKNIISVFEEDDKCKEVIKAAEKFLEENTPRELAGKYIQLFKKL